MKKILIIILALVMTVAFTSVTLASTLDVNVAKGYSISLEKPDTDADPFTITGDFGISDKLLFSVGYITENEWDEDAFTIGGRYEFIKNGAVSFEYTFADDDDIWTIDLRGKLDLSGKLALTGLLGYIDGDSLDETFRVLGQVEYDLCNSVTGNLGFDYYNNDDVDTTLVITGLEFYPTKKITFWVDYNYNTDDDDDDEDWLGLGVEFKF